MRGFWVALTAIAIVLLPAVAMADPTACDLLTKADVEQVTGLSVDDPILQKLGEDHLCGGFCGGRGSSCTFTSSAGHSVVLTFMLPPLGPGDMKAGVRMAAESAGKQISDIDDLGTTGLWTFVNGDGELSFFFEPRFRITVSQNAIVDQSHALADARALAKIALSRSDAR